MAQTAIVSQDFVALLGNVEEVRKIIKNKTKKRKKKTTTTKTRRRKRKRRRCCEMQTNKRVRRRTGRRRKRRRRTISIHVIIMIHSNTLFGVHSIIISTIMVFICKIKNK